jgi:hypothetical protein
MLTVVKSASLVGGHLLRDGESLLWIDHDALGVADKHVDDSVCVADACYVLVEWERAGSTDDVDLGP